MWVGVWVGGGGGYGQILTEQVQGSIRTSMDRLWVPGFQGAETELFLRSEWEGLDLATGTEITPNENIYTSNRGSYYEVN